jgi:chorismate mutase
MGVQGGGNFWGFLASISPFESLRKYLIFRHKRDQDHCYRDAEEARRLALENDARELALLEKRVKIAKQLGATKEQLEPLCNRVLRCAAPNPLTVLPPALPPREPLLLTGGAEKKPTTSPDRLLPSQAVDGLG